MNNNAVRNLTQTALLTATLCVSSFISIPFAVPFTLQTFAIALCLTSVGTLQTLKVLAVYTFLGFCSVPVFSGFRAGLSVLAEPSGGFIIGFFFMALAYGAMCKILPSFKLKTYIALSLSLVVLHLCGILWYAFLYLEISPQGIASSFAVTSAVYILPDVAKVAAGGFCAGKIKKYLKNG